jgi:hypothetical protein
LRAAVIWLRVEGCGVSVEGWRFLVEGWELRVTVFWCRVKG